MNKIALEQLKEKVIEIESDMQKNLIVHDTIQLDDVVYRIVRTVQRSWKEDGTDAPDTLELCALLVIAEQALKDVQRYNDETARQLRRVLQDRQYISLTMQGK